MRERSWQLVLPVKGGPAAKSRLATASPRRTALARALALDCLSAALASSSVDAVLVVSPDPDVLAEAEGRGARGVREHPSRSGLDAAVSHGLAHARPGPVAVLLADLPCLRAADLNAGLAACSGALDGGAEAVVVPDASGTGTVLLAALDARDVSPAFGPASAAAHERRGAVRLDLDLPRLRRDVDTPDDLTEALRLGVGPATEAALCPQDAASA